MSIIKVAFDVSFYGPDARWLPDISQQKYTLCFTFSASATTRQGKGRRSIFISSLMLLPQ